MAILTLVRLYLYIEMASSSLILKASKQFPCQLHATYCERWKVFESKETKKNIEPSFQEKTSYSLESKIYVITESRDSNYAIWQYKVLSIKKLFWNKIMWEEKW